MAKEPPLRLASHLHTKGGLYQLYKALSKSGKSSSIRRGTLVILSFFIQSNLTS